MEQHLLSAGPLLDENGLLCEKGFAYTLVKDYDRKKIKYKPIRIKECDYYYVGNKDFGLVLSISQNGYKSLASLSVVDFVKKKHVTKSIEGWFNLGNLPSSSRSGQSLFEDKRKGVSFSFSSTNGKRRLLCNMNDFPLKGQSFRCDIYLMETCKKSMVITETFKKGKGFNYNQKINNMEASGYAKVGEETFYFKEGSYAVLDWSRGVWPYRSHIYWSSVNSVLNGVPFGFNLGYGSFDTSKGTENMLFVGEEAFKLGDVRFDIPFSKTDFDYLKPWRFRNDEESIDITFTPVIDRVENRMTVLRKRKEHQVFGLFSGRINVNGKDYSFFDLPGFASSIVNRW